MMVIKGRPFVIIRDWIGRGFSSIDQDRIFFRRELTVFKRPPGTPFHRVTGKALLQGFALTFRR